MQILETLNRCSGWGFCLLGIFAVLVHLCLHGRKGCLHEVIHRRALPVSHLKGQEVAVDRLAHLNVHIGIHRRPQLFSQANQLSIDLWGQTNGAGNLTPLNVLLLLFHMHLIGK